MPSKELIDRNLMIVELRSTGVKLQDIANRFKITRARVHQILSRYRGNFKIPIEVDELFIVEYICKAPKPRSNEPCGKKFTSDKRKGQVKKYCSTACRLRVWNRKRSEAYRILYPKDKIA
jgi:hypothetical protein